MAAEIKDCGPTRAEGAVRAAAAGETTLGVVFAPGPRRYFITFGAGARARALLPGHQMVLAGGLTPETVSDAISGIRPDIVDVSSGDELRPGIKDPLKVIRFMEAVVGHHSSC